MLRQLDEALKSLTLDGTDGAAVELARTYARAIDAGDSLDKRGPQLLAVLESLGMTPRSRAALMKGETHAVTSPLDELRERRATRVGNA